jgi:hypothetical protein
MKEIVKSLKVKAPVEAVYKLLREDRLDLRITPMLSDLVWVDMIERYERSPIVVDGVAPSRVAYEWHYQGAHTKFTFDLSSAGEHTAVDIRLEYGGMGMMIDAFSQLAQVLSFIVAFGEGYQTGLRLQKMKGV